MIYDDYIDKDNNHGSYRVVIIMVLMYRVKFPLPNEVKMIFSFFKKKIDLFFSIYFALKYKKNKKNYKTNRVFK